LFADVLRTNFIPSRRLTRPMEEQEEEVIRRRSWALRILLGLLILLLLAVLLLWWQRRQIASEFIDRELARKGVQATYQVKRIGFRTQRFENLVIGDSKQPDAVARWVEVELSLGFRKPKVEMIRARGVLLLGRIVGGKLKLGQIDRLLPPPTGAPFRFPDQEIDVADTAIALDTPAGRMGLALEGKGNLASGFKGRIAGRSSRMMAGGCAVARPVLFGTVAITARRPSFEGPVSASRVVCPRAKLAFDLPRLALNLVVPERMNAWQGGADVSAAAARVGSDSFAGVRGSVSFNGDKELTRGAVKLAAAGSRFADLQAAGLSINGRYALSPADGRISLVGDAAGRGLVAGGTMVRPLVQALNGARGTPVGPLAGALGVAAERAVRGFDARGTLRLVNGGGSGAVRFETLQATSRSGARLAFRDGDGLTYYWPAGLARLDGDFRLSGGGFPMTNLNLAQARGGAPIRGVAYIAPMAVGDARLQLTQVRFTAASGGATRVDTTAMIDGPFKNGRVDGLLLPVSGRFAGGGFAFGESCTPIGFRALRAQSLRLGTTQLRFCPTGRALLWKTPSGRVQGGALISQPRLAGRLGQSPITLGADQLRLALATPGFTSANVAVRLGRPESVSRLDLSSLSGRFSANGVAGVFAGGSGKLGNVPLLLSNARGDWSVLRGRVAVGGAMTVSDAAELPRFYPLVTNDFQLTMVKNQITAKGWLADPETGTRVTLATINHSLGKGRGNAVLDVPGIRFDEDYQPEELTRLSLGVVALVNGVVQGRGDIAWGPEGASSTGTFSTKNMNLAAAFGPVEGLTTTINFSNLLGLETAPGQIANINVVRTGIDVFDGIIRYQLLPGQKVKVEGGRWPFAGGELFLEETILDFSRPSTRRLVFRVAGLDAARFIQQMEFSNITATGIFDGVIPMEFDAAGGRIVGGKLIARPEGGTLSYIGELTDKQLGVYGKLAFDALKSLRYSKFSIGLDGSLAGEFVAAIELDGIARDPALGKIDTGGGVRGIVARRALGQLAKIPFEFNITIKGPFRTLLSTARSVEDPSMLIQTALPPELRKPSNKTTTTVQTKESEPVR
jgi:hypothetical protein